MIWYSSKVRDVKWSVWLGDYVVKGGIVCFN